MTARLAFELPAELAASAPPEARGLTRDAVRMLVASRATEELVHSTFTLLPRFLSAGDIVVVNTSATIPAALRGLGRSGPLVIHLSTRLDGELWVVEPRRATAGGSDPWPAGEELPGFVVLDGGDARLELLGRYRGSRRLWLARLQSPQPVELWLARHGSPIRYGYVSQPWPLAAYQTVYGTEPGSAEMPSAGRPFTAEVITRLVAKGVEVAPLVLHAGVSSLEAGELPQPERVKVPGRTAERVNAARAAGGRVIAVGTTVVRALESAAGPGRRVRALDGWTELVVSPASGVQVVDGLLTGWHEPKASHLLMLEAIAGRTLLERCYEAGLTAGYLWHEFGDVHLLLP